MQNQTENEGLKEELSTAIGIIQDVLMQADASIDKETRDDAMQDLQERIDDWKQLQFSTFGELLLIGSFNVLKESGLRPDEKEYHLYLFSHILIMCKDINANKSMSRLNTRQTMSLRGKPKMNLKGRIYFTNLISITPQSSPSNYALQISWKGETAMDTFIIKFKNDETLQKWHTMIQTQRSASILEAKARGTSDTQLLSLQGMSMENPYLHSQEEDEDYSRMSATTYGGTDVSGYSDFSMSRNASSTSLRARSATGGSGGSNPRMRIPTSDMSGLTLNTRGLPAQSPQDYPGNSYFSPTDRESSAGPPGSMSSRSSSQSAFAGYNRGTTPVSAGLYRPEESHRNTAPAMARNPNGQVTGNPYLVNGQRSRGPPSAGGMGPPRMRSASSPDVHPMVQQGRKYVSGEHAPSVPPIPAHMAKQMGAPSRSQSNSPINNPPSRGSTPHQQYGLPSSQRPSVPNHGYTYDGAYGTDPRKPGHMASLSQGRAFSPPVSSPTSDGDSYLPSQLKAKVCFDENYVSMIIASNIQFGSLAERIDAKLARFTNHSISSGSVRLRYKDEDGDFVLIDSDEAVHEALLDWRETQSSNINAQNAELLLFAHVVHNEAPPNPA